MIILRNERMPLGKVHRVQMRGRPIFVLEFGHGRLNGAEVFAAHLPNDHERAQMVRDWAVQHAKYSLYMGEDADLEWGLDASVAAPMPSPLAPLRADQDDTMHPAERMAFQMGWAVQDLLGTCTNNDPTEAGGISPRTGLCLSEMATSAPPANWDQWAETSYVWERPDWQPPSANFKPRHGLTSKGGAAPTEAEIKADLPATLVEAPEHDAEPAVPPELDVVVPETPAEPEVVPEPETPAEPEPQVEVAPAAGQNPHLALIIQLRDEADGKVPSWQKFVHHQNKQGLEPRIDKAAFDGLVASL